MRAPATSANLGPGFDALGLALGIYLECSFRQAPSLRIRAGGRDAALISTGEDNLIWQTALKVAADTGGTLDPIELEIRNDIPIGKGLGSSAAALIAGVVIADRPLTEIVPLQQKGAEQEIVTQLGMWDIVELGLLKMDFLGLRNLDVIDQAVELIGGWIRSLPPAGR